MIKVTFLGTNGWYDTETGSTPCILIETDKEYIVLDAGFGLYKLKEIVKTRKPVHLFISHLHYDHLIGLHTLPIFRLEQGIDIYVPKISAKGLRAFLKRPFTSPPLLLPTRIRFHEIAKGGRSPVPFEMLRLRHSVPCYGYRFILGSSTVVYCTDTGLCNNLKRLASGADLLITECAMAPGDKSPTIFHITPEAAATVAKDAGAKALALAHFDPGRYPTFAERAAAEASAKKIFADTIAAKDFTNISLL